MTGFNSKRDAAADKDALFEKFEVAQPAQPAQEPPSEWEGIKAILDEYGLQAIDFVADFKAALAQPAQEPYDQTALELCNVCGWKTLIPDDGCLNCERVQPAQEPVAWMVTYQDGSREVVYEAPSNLHPDYSDIPTSITPFYTTPPKREWVGLTDDDEIPWDGVDAKSFARAIEAKLKEKNNG